MKPRHWYSPLDRPLNPPPAVGPTPYEDARLVVREFLAGLVFLAGILMVILLCSLADVRS